MAPHVIIKRLPGLIKYTNGLNFQNHYLNAVKDKFVHDKTPVGYILLLQHTPVYTTGIQKSTYTDEYCEHLAKMSGADVVKTRRGGFITFHGPGQLVCYPILDLKRLPNVTGAKDLVCNLEKTIINLLKESYNLTGTRSEDTGIWIGNDKICAMGLQIKNGISCHGIALNCNTDMDWFNKIVPCGLIGKGVTSLSIQKNEDILVDTVTSQFIKCFGEVFELEVL